MSLPQLSISLSTASAESHIQAAAALQDELAQLTQTLQSAQDSADDAQSEVLNHATESADLRAQLSGITEKLIEREDEVQQLTQALSISEEDAEEAKEDAAAHEDAATDFLEELDQSRADKAVLESQVQDIKVCTTPDMSESFAQPRSDLMWFRV